MNYICVGRIGKTRVALSCFCIIVFLALIYLCGCSDNRYKELDVLYDGLRNEKFRDQSAMGFFKNKDNSCKYLLGRLEKESDANMRKIAINIIGGLKCKGYEDNLLKFVNDRDWQVQFMTIDTLVQLDYKDIVPLLRTVIASDNDMRVIGRAIWALGERGSEADLAYINKIGNEDKYNIKMIHQFIDLANKKYSERLKVDARAR